MPGTIRITKVPRGEAPLWVRQCWVGLELPCEDIGSEDQDTLSVVTREQISDLRPFTWAVSQQRALWILYGRHYQAAAWWYKHGYPKAGRVFSFAEDEAELISGSVTQIECQ